MGHYSPGDWEGKPKRVFLHIRHP